MKPARPAPPPPPRAARTVTPDPDYIADVEASEGQAVILKRIKQRERGQAVSKPKGLEPR